MARGSCLALLSLGLSPLFSKSVIGIKIHQVLSTAPGQGRAGEWSSCLLHLLEAAMLLVSGPFLHLQSPSLHTCSAIT